MPGATYIAEDSMFDSEALSKMAATTAQRVVAEFARKLTGGGDATARDQDFRAVWLVVGVRVLGKLMGEFAGQLAAARECASPGCG